jgi:hypothetical protein
MANLYRVFASLLLLSGSALVLAQPVVDYAIDTDGDGSPEGILYRDTVYDADLDVLAWTDHSAGPPAFTYARDQVLYDGSTEDLRLDIYAANPGSDSLARRDKPVVFFFYGGGFVNGFSKRVEDLCREYASRGYVTVAPNYRLGFAGADTSDGVELCDNLLPSLEAVYRAILDAQSAMRWVRDSLTAKTGIVVDPDYFYLHGPSVFSLISHIQAAEVPLFLRPLGELDDSLRVRAGVGRSASLMMADRFINRRDTTPFLIFHGTCDKSVPFTETLLSVRNGCDTVVPPGTIIPGDVSLFGSYDIAQAVRHYVEYYPICGLHHSHKDIERGRMREPVAQFLYNMTAGRIRASDPPLFYPFIQAPCDVNRGKCTPADRYSWCSWAEQLPPNDSSACRPASRRIQMQPPGAPEPMVHPNPAPVGSSRYFRWTAAYADEISAEVFDAQGRLLWRQVLRQHPGTNQLMFRLPANTAAGMGLIRLSGSDGASVHSAFQMLPAP